MGNNGSELYSACMDKERDYLIAASDVKEYLRSPFNVYCKYFADPSERDPQNKAIEILSKRGILHEAHIRKTKYSGADVMTNKNQTEEERARFDPVAAGERVLEECESDSFRKGIELMVAGKRVIATCPLYDLRRGMCGTPDILERHDGQSLLGSYHYVVKEIKQARNIQWYHAMQAAFYNLLIGRIQGYVPESFYVVNGDGTEKEFQFSYYESCLEDVLAKIAKIRDGTEAPAPKYGSLEYPWKEFGLKRLLKTGNISIISNMGKRDLQTLKENGIRTIQDMASSEFGNGSKFGIDADSIRSYRLSAESLMVGSPIRRVTPKIPMPRQGKEIFLDIISCRTWGNDAGAAFTVYMIGALIRSGDNKRHALFIADNVDGKGMLDGFLELVGGMKSHAVYHSNVRGWECLKGMMDQRNVRKSVVSSIASRLHNLHGRAVALYAFPTLGNDINSIAACIGFKRPHVEIDAKLICPLYREYCKDPGANVDILEMMKWNSMDNCMAMAALRDWLDEDAKKARATSCCRSF